MNEKLREEIELKDDCDNFIYPGKIPAQDEDIIEQMLEVLSHERFNHEGWIDYNFYKKQACYFLLKVIKNEN